MGKASYPEDMDKINGLASYYFQMAQKNNNAKLMVTHKSCAKEHSKFYWFIVQLEKFSTPLYYKYGGLQSEILKQGFEIRDLKMFSEHTMDKNLRHELLLEPVSRSATRSTIEKQV